jgi:integrase
MSKRFEKLTRLEMRALLPGKRIVEHGIVYEKLKSGDGRFELCIQVNGKRMHRVVGNESEGITRMHAEQAIEKLKNEARMGRISLPKGRKLHLSFKQAAQQYLERLVVEGGNSLDTKERQLKQQLVPFFDTTPLASISSFQVEQFKSHCINQGLAPATVNRYLAVLSQLLHKAVEWNWLEKSPVKIKKYKESPGRITYLTRPQIEALLKAAKADDSAAVYPFIMIGLETGMRRMEILSIRLEHIDLTRRVIYLPQAKAGAREQPISAHLTEFLQDYLVRYTKVAQEWLFPSKNSRPGHMIAIEKAFRRVVKAAGLDPSQVVRHTLRHTAITHLVQAGVDLPTVKKISGHKTLQMVERYAHQNNEHIQQALAKLDGRYRP